MKKLKRTRQCKKCPWRVDTDPHDIPDGYSEELHRKLRSTISQSPLDTLTKRVVPVMGCHEHTTPDEVMCVGWLMQQLNQGNNLAMRLAINNYANAHKLETVGEQHKTFEDTLP